MAIRARVWNGEVMMSLSMAMSKDLVGVQHDQPDGYELEPFFDGVSVMLHSRCKDDSGVDIYEDDILEAWDGDCINYDDDDNEIIGKRHIITVTNFNVIDVSGFGYDWDIWTLGWAQDNGVRMKVIGNIHQNPELVA